MGTTDLYYGTNGPAHGVIEHDCLDCMHSWDLKHNQVEECCRKCGSYNIVSRPSVSGIYHQVNNKAAEDHRAYDEPYSKYVLHMDGWD